MSATKLHFNKTDDYARYRRRDHSNIEAMQNLILDRIVEESRLSDPEGKGHPYSPILHDFISGLQSSHGGGEHAFETFSRSHLTIAKYLRFDGKPEAQEARIRNRIKAQDRWQKRVGYELFKITPGGQPLSVLRPDGSTYDGYTSTAYIDRLEPIADAAVMRARASDQWRGNAEKGIKAHPGLALAAQVDRAMEELKKVAGIAKETNDKKPEPARMPLTDYELQQERRILDSVEKVAGEIDLRAGDGANWAMRMARKLARLAESLERTYRSRTDYASLTIFDEDEGDEIAHSGKDNTSNKTDQDAASEMDQTEEGGGLQKYHPPLANPSEIIEIDFDDAEESDSALMLEAAEAYAKEGLPVFPTKPDKRPYTLNGFKDATTDLERIRAWWKLHPDAGIGLPTGRATGLLVIDIDPRHGGDVSFTQLIEQHGPLPKTLEAATGGGGQHIALAYPKDVEIRNSAGKLGEGIDVRGEGGYIIASPTRHPSGKCYRWLNDHQPAPCPEWVIKRLLAKPEIPDPTQRPSTETYSISGGVIPDGERNERLFKIACAIWGNGQAQDLTDLHAQMLATNSARCSPPLTEVEVAKLCASVCARYVRGVAIEKEAEYASAAYVH